MTQRDEGQLRRKGINMMLTVVNNVGVLFTWSVHISKYGNQHKYKEKIRQNQEKKEEASCRQVLTRLGNCLHGLCTFSNMVIDANMPRTPEKEEIME